MTSEETLSLGRAYLLWFPPFGLVGAHHFYLNRTGWGVLFLCTFGLLGCGWIFDFFVLPLYVKRAKRGLGRDNKCTLAEAYVLWMPFGLVGFHHFYLRRPAFGVLYLCTFGCFGVGWIFDFFRMARLVRQANKPSSSKPDFTLDDAYTLWFPPLGLFGGHHWYLGNYYWGTLYLCTFGLLGIGWIYDALSMISLVRRAQKAFPPPHDSAESLPSVPNKDYACQVDDFDIEGEQKENHHDIEVQMPSAPPPYEAAISEGPLSPAPVNMTCTVCMDRKIDAVYLDCGHSSTCLPCAQQMLAAGNQDCPICRKPCRIVRRIFIAAAES